LWLVMWFLFTWIGIFPLVEMMGFDSHCELRSLVADGSNSPPDCYSLPSLFESLPIRNCLVLFGGDLNSPLVEMMGFDSRTNCVLGLPRSRTSTGSSLCTVSPSNPRFCL